VPTAAEALWWGFLATVLAVGVLVGALGLAVVVAQQRLVGLHRSYGQRLLAAQDEERAHVAREVHDDAIQRLALLSHELHELERPGTLSAGQLHHLSGILGEVEDLAVSLRRLAHRLHPTLIGQVGLAPALEQLAEELLRTSGLTVHLALPPAPVALAPDASLTLFRTAQEALRNVMRHAGVAEAWLTLRQSPRDVELVVEDRGRGFSRNASRKVVGIGLIGIEERAQLVGGEASIASRPGRGTTVTVRVPVRGRDR
jgi:two-component system sensor histidine kinase UhpB